MYLQHIFEISLDSALGDDPYSCELSPTKSITPLPDEDVYQKIKQVDFLFILILNIFQNHSQ